MRLCIYSTYSINFLCAEFNYSQIITDEERHNNGILSIMVHQTHITLLAAYVFTLAKTLTNLYSKSQMTVNHTVAKKWLIQENLHFL